MKPILLLLCSLTAISCATIGTGSRETIAVSSSPSGADAKLVCEKESASGVTPAQLTIRRNAGDCMLTISRAGFEPVTTAIEQGVNPAYWTNMLFSPLAPGGGYLLYAGNTEERAIGVASLITAGVVFGTDFATGAVHAHKPNHVDVVLKPRP